MFKIFLVDSHTQLSTEMKVLMATGMDYLPTFEVSVGIVNFCTDLEIIATGIDLDSKVFLLINGFKMDTEMPSMLLENGVTEVDINYLKNNVKNGIAVRQVGSTQMLKHLNYSLSLNGDNTRLWGIKLTGVEV